MTMLFKSAALALALAGAGFTSGCMMEGDHDGGRHMSDRDHDGGAVSLNFGTVAFGYNDGYWDNDHQWHSWASDNDSRGYRDYQGNHYHDWKHDRDADMGWTRN